MAINRKLSDLPIKNTVAATDYVHILDPLDLTDSPQGSDKRVLVPIAEKYVNQINVSASTTILESWNGAIVIIRSAGVVLTVPAGLPAKFTFDSLTRPAATCDFAITAPKVWVNGTPTLVPEKSTFVFIVDSLNSNEVYLSEPSSVQENGLEIIDAVRSIEVNDNITTLIKEYDLGVLTSKKMLDFTFLFHKTIIASETINAQIVLYDTVSSTEYVIGFRSSNGNSQHIGLTRYCALNTDLLTIIETSSSYDSSVIVTTDNVDSIVINSANSFKLRVYIFNGWVGTGMRQYFGKINLK